MEARQEAPAAGVVVHSRRREALVQHLRERARVLRAREAVLGPDDEVGHAAHADDDVESASLWPAPHGAHAVASTLAAAESHAAPSQSASERQGSPTLSPVPPALHAAMRVS